MIDLSSREAEETSLSNFTTVVSQYFPLEVSKHSKTEYNKWLRTMLLSVSSSPLIFYTDSNTAKLVYRIRSNTSLFKTTCIIYENIWSMLSKVERQRGVNYSFSYKRNQFDLDPEKSIHTPELYAIWNLKSFMMKETIKTNPYSSSFFIYTDAGAWRYGVQPGWPSTELVYELSKKLNNHILFGQTDETCQGYHKCSSLIQGTFFAGSAQAMLNFERDFWRLHDQLLEQNQFVGKDQNLMRSIAFKTDHGHVSQVARLRNWKNLWIRLLCDYDYDPWFFYQVYFSQGSSQFKCSIKLRFYLFVLIDD